MEFATKDLKLDMALCRYLEPQRLKPGIVADFGALSQL
jgi:hypothetical protein